MTQHELVAAGDRLPAALLDPVRGRPLDLHLAPSDSTVVVFPHPDCGACTAYLRDLDGLSGDLAVWDGRLVAVVTDGAEARAVADRVTFPVLVDPTGRARSGAGVTAHGAAVVVADRYGTVYRSDALGREHAFPGADELRTEVRYIAIQCPECTVADLSGGQG